MSKIRFTAITKGEFEVWVNNSLTDSQWGEISSFYLEQIEPFIDYVTETLVDDFKNKVGIFTPNEGEKPK
jgi:hypothetical protein